MVPREDGKVQRSDGKWRKPDKGRQDRRSPAEVRAIVKEIAALMSTGQWFPSLSRRQFAEKYGVSDGQVAQWAGRAAAVVHEAGDDDLAERKASYLSHLERTLARCNKALSNLEAVEAGDRNFSHDGKARAISDLAKTITNTINELTKISGVDRSDTPRGTNVNVIVDGKGRWSQDAERLMTTVIECVKGCERCTNNLQQAFPAERPKPLPQLPQHAAEDAEFEEYDDDE